MSGDYSPETNGSPELEVKGVASFQVLIGILSWVSEIGRVDILT